MAIDGNNFQISHPVAAIYKLSPSTLADGEQDVLHTDANHNLKVAYTGPTGASSQSQQGAAAAGAAVVGNPVLVGGTDGTNAETLLLDINGAVRQAPGNGAWSVTNTCNANLQGTASQAAGGAGVKNVVTGFSGQLFGDGTGNADTATINVRDGATGAGTVLFSFRLALATGASGVGTPFIVTGINIPGTANTAMTIEGSTIGAAHTQTTVNMWGFKTK